MIYRRRTYRSFSRVSWRYAIARSGQTAAERDMSGRRPFVWTKDNAPRFAPPPQLQTPVRQRRTLTTR